MDEKNSQPDTKKLDSEEVKAILKAQHEYFMTGETRALDFRINQLKKLKQAIKDNENLIIEALYEDLHKSEFEAYSAEVGYIYDSIDFIVKNLKKWAKPKHVKTPITLLGCKSMVYSEPYGVSLIVGPFNYPFQLLIEPLLGAIAAGNTAVLKPSPNTPRVTAIISKIISESFAPNFIQVVEGGIEEMTALINSRFDYIFFTGSINVGKIIMAAAAKNLVPVTLELGGKSPAIVDNTAELEIAAKRIVWGKFFNAGQTCIAPDYVLVHKDVKEEFLQLAKQEILNFYGDDPFESPDYGRLVSQQQVEKLAKMLVKDKIFHGGQFDVNNKYMAPTILNNVDWDDRVMEEEIFGPIMPVIGYTDLDYAIRRIQGMPKPLSLYIFTEDKEVEKIVLEEISFGGGCVNEAIMHVASPYLPFGGVGQSGIGNYHGEHSFLTFSHRKSILKRTTKLAMDLFLPPYTKKNLDMIKKFLK